MPIFVIVVFVVVTVIFVVLSLMGRRRAGEALAAVRFEGQDEAISAMGAPFWWPLWLYGLEDADGWLLAAPEEERRVLVLDLWDPHDARSWKNRSMVIDSTAFLLAEQLGLTLGVQVGAAVMVDVARRKVLTAIGAAPPFAELTPFVNALESTPVVIWGEAGYDVEQDGLAFRIRTPDGEESGRTCRLSGAADELADSLVRTGVARRREPPSWYLAPRPEERVRYSELLDLLHLVILADRDNGFLPSFDAEFHNECSALALRSLLDFPRAGEQWKLIAATMALYGTRAAALDENVRRAAVALVLSVDDPAHPLFRLSPLYLAAFQEQERARERHGVLRTVRLRSGCRRWPASTGYDDCRGLVPSEGDGGR